MTQPYHLPERQQYAIEQERQRHNQALYAFGEYAMFCLLWRRTDYDAGLVGSCLRCVVPYGAIAEVYQQSADSKCPECFGTSYAGGFKALLVRPSLWDYTEEATTGSTRGVLISQSASVQTTADFRLRTNDFIFRVDGSRWQMRTMSTNHLRTGFTPSQNDAVGYNFGTVGREDEDSVAYLIPPATETLTEILAEATTRHAPTDWREHEVIRGPVT